MKTSLRMFVFAITAICFVSSFNVYAVTEKEAKKLCRELKEQCPQIKIPSYESFSQDYSLFNRLFQSPLDAYWELLCTIKKHWASKHDKQDAEDKQAEETAQEIIDSLSGNAVL